MCARLIRKNKKLTEENKNLKSRLKKEINDAMEFASQTSETADAWKQNFTTIYEENRNKDLEIMNLKEQINELKQQMKLVEHQYRL